MSHAIVVGGTNQIMVMFAEDSATGLPKTDLLAADITLLEVTRVGSTDIAIASPTDKASPNATHADGAVYNDGGGNYLVDVPDSAVANQVPSVRLNGDWLDGSTSGILVGIPHPIVGYDGTSVAVGANVVVPPTLTEMTSAFTEIKGATWSSSTDTLEDIRNATTGSGNTFNSPIYSSQIQRVNDNTITIYEGETNPITITGIKDVYNVAIDLSSYSNMVFIIAEKTGKVLQTITHASLTVGGTDNNELTFTNNSTVSLKGKGDSVLRWSLRDADNGDKVIVGGVISIESAATS